MSAMDGLERRAKGVARDFHSNSLRRLLVGAVIAALVAAAFLGGHRLASIWSALAILAWMFTAGAAQASAD